MQRNKLYLRPSELTYDGIVSDTVNIVSFKGKFLIGPAIVRL